MTISMRKVFARPRAPYEAISMRDSLSKHPRLSLSLRDERLTEFITVEKEETFVRFLRPGDSAEITFVPVAGIVTIYADAIPHAEPEPGLRPGTDAEPEPGLPSSVMVKLFSAESELVATHVFLQRLTTDRPPDVFMYEVPEDKAGGSWRCQFNRGAGGSVQCSGSVSFQSSKHELHTTAIPIRLLNHAAFAFLRVLSLKIRLDEGGSFIDVSQGINEISGGRIRRRDFALPDQVEDINLSSIAIKALQESGKPIIRVWINFEEGGKEINVQWPRQTTTSKT